MTSSRKFLSSAELTDDLGNLGSAASVIENALADMLDTKSLPANTLPSLQAARRAVRSLVTHLDGARTLAEAS